MAEKMNEEYYSPGTAAFNYNLAGGADSASGGSGGSGMECLRSPPGPFQYLISEQAKSLVALQELQNEVGALLEFRDLVIETFPNLRSKMAPSTPAAGPRRDWEPGVRVRRKLLHAGETSRTKPQPSVQDSGFSTETSCGKDAHSSASASASARSRPVEAELWALLDVIQRKGVRLRDEAELLRGEINRHSQSETAEESFARALSNGCLECDCQDARRLRKERDDLLMRSADLEAKVAVQKADLSPLTPQPVAASSPSTPLGRLDDILGTPQRPPRVATPESHKFAAILRESNPVELQRHLLSSTVRGQSLSARLHAVAADRASLVDNLDRCREENEDLKFQLEEKTIELEGTKAKVRLLEGKQKPITNDSVLSEYSRGRDYRDRDSMKDMEPLHMPDDSEAKISETPRRSRPSRIPLHMGGHKGLAPKPPTGAPRSTCSRDSVPYRSTGESPARPPSSHSCRSVASSRSRRDSVSGKKEFQSASAKKPEVPIRRFTRDSPDNKGAPQNTDTLTAHSGDSGGCEPANYVTRRDSEDGDELITEYLTRTDNLAQKQNLFSRIPHYKLGVFQTEINSEYRLAYESPQNLALELSKSILYESIDSIDVNALNLQSLNSHVDSKLCSGDSLWNGKPQHYFESMHYGDRLHDRTFFNKCNAE